jgi:hypothetical protein
MRGSVGREGPQSRAWQQQQQQHWEKKKKQRRRRRRMQRRRRILLAGVLGVGEERAIWQVGEAL